MYAALAWKARAEGSDMLLGPYVGLSRIPFAGRNFESMGEDPYLASELVASYVHAQNDQKILGCVKHFALNDQEYRRTDVNSIADERTLHELHLVPYERAVKEGVGSVMASYNKINGLWASENPTLLASILKRQWRFPGFVVSDWGATHSTVPAALAGLDLEMPSGKFFNSKLIQAVKDGGGKPNGGSCYNCHQIDKKEISFGTIGPSLYNYGKLRGVTDADSPAAKPMLEYTWGKIWNAKAYNACSNMPRFGHMKLLSEAQLRDLMSLLLDPRSLAQNYDVLKDLFMGARR